jgi:hypothetical protein
LFQDFLQAHSSNGTYAGMSINIHIRPSTALNLELLVNNNEFKGRSHGNDFFNSLLIQDEVNLTDGHPMSNANASHSPVWTEEYERRSQLMAVDTFGSVPMPHRDCKTSDEVQLQEVTSKILDVRNGRAPLSSLPHYPIVNRSDETFLREAGHMAPKGLPSNQLLRRACVGCHHSKLDQNISRARFNAEDLTLNTRESLEEAIRRLQMRNHDLELMPPENYMRLTDEEKLSLLVHLYNELDGRQ